METITRDELLNNKIKELGYEIITKREMDNYYENYIKLEPLPYIDLDKLEWIEFGGYFRKHFYIKDKSEIMFAIFKTAYYYPNGTIEDDNEKIVIED